MSSKSRSYKLKPLMPTYKQHFSMFCLESENTTILACGLSRFKWAKNGFSILEIDDGFGYSDVLCFVGSFG